jgi:DNA-3-methyladenine glycosylase I
MARDLVRGPDGRHRCFWGASDAEMQAYHDAEWGFPVTDDRRLFEKICLEGFQAGLSWRTILLRRPAFRRAFAGFDVDRVARFPARKVETLLRDASIIRHRGKIESVLNNARAARALREEFGSLAAYFWRFEPPAKSRPARVTRASLAATSRASVALSKDLKRRGFTFVGPTTAYAFMQAVGLVDDHLHGCAIRAEVERARARLRRPSPAADA